MSAILEYPSPDNQGTCPFTSQIPFIGGIQQGITGSTWTPGAKNGIGTSFYDPDSGPSLSNVWFTLTKGILTEIYYPTLSQPNLQTLQFIVTDRKTFTDVEFQDTKHETFLINEDSLVYRQLNTAYNHRYKITKTYVTDPQQNTVLIHVEFQVYEGILEDYNLLLHVNPALTNNAADDLIRIAEDSNGKKYGLIQDEDTCLVILSSLPFMKASARRVSASANLSDWIETLANLPDETVRSFGPGDVNFLAQMNMTGEQRSVSFTVALGFGDSEAGALQAARVSLDRTFEAVSTMYGQGWQGYLSKLDLPHAASPRHYYAAAMVVKAHEDKLHPGAITASLSIPWGESVRATTSEIGGYHLVWVRDLYQVASTLDAIGDHATAQRALKYLAETLQQPDGTFPQNAWVDGTPYWHGIQQDQIAFPILLAYQLGAYNYYPSLVKSAADFLVQHGPSTDQERWEENSGYSPSTMAAAIAALVTAGEMARFHRDFASAAIYLATADTWVDELDSLTITRNGSLSDKPYYIRVNDSSNPDDGHWIEIKNGSGWYPKTDIVDAGFLELVRLGIKRADDEFITNSLNVVDHVLKYDTQNGPVWYRYNHDGYGEKTDGSPYDGTGKGRPWPVLIGERGEYEIALTKLSSGTRPENVYGSTALLRALESCANEGLMIPEQIWDDEPQPQFHLKPGYGTGSATPLAWAMAQYLRLSKCIESSRIVEMPEGVEKRYITEPVTNPLPFVIEIPRNHLEQSTPEAVITGRTEPGSTVVARQGRHALASGTADQHGRFSLSLELCLVGRQTVDVIAYDNARTVTVRHISLTYRPPIVFHYHKSQLPLMPPMPPTATGVPVENISMISIFDYPTAPVFKPGDFELHEVQLSADRHCVYFEIQLGNLDNPWQGPSGISKQIIDIYVDLDGKADSGQRSTMGFNAHFSSDAAWEKLIRISGNWQGDSRVYNSDWSHAGPVEIQTDTETNTLIASVPLSVFGTEPKPEWGIMVVLAGECQGKPRPVLACADEWSFGCPKFAINPPLFVDLMIPAGASLQAILEQGADSRTDSGYILPTIRISDSIR